MCEFITRDLENSFNVLEKAVLCGWTIISVEMVFKLKRPWKNF